MSLNTKYYKIKTIKKFLQETNQVRDRLMTELIVNATDPVLFKRRFRMLEHLCQYEQQIIKKLKNFETDEIEDFEIAHENIRTNLNLVLNKSA